VGRTICLDLLLSSVVYGVALDNCGCA
jgi:hypothetical protein